MADKTKVAFVAVLLSALLLPSGGEAQVKKLNKGPKIKLVDTYDKPVNCEVYKNTGGRRINLGQTDDGVIDVGKDCLSGDTFEFTPVDPTFNGISKKCSLQELTIRVYTKRQIENLAFNSTIYLKAPNDKRAIAISAMSKLELAGVFQDTESEITDSLSRQVYVLTGRWLGLKETGATFSNSKDFAGKIKSFQKDKGIKVNYLESNTLSAMAGIDTWDVYTRKIDLP